MLAPEKAAVISFHDAPKKIACGLYHSASISDLEHGHGGLQLLKDGITHLYTWGRNTHCQLGQGDKPEQLVPNKVDTPEDEGGEAKYGDLNYYEVACGSCHTLSLLRTPDGGSQVFACGLRAGGRLGFDRKDGADAEKALVPVPFKKEFSEHVIVRICCGSDHSLCLSQLGMVFAWGENAEGQCGVGRPGKVLQPEPLSSFPRQRSGELAKVKHLAAGARHSLMVTCELNAPGGSLYTWGCNQQCRLGLGHAENQFAPALVRSIADANLVIAAGGEAHSGAVDTDRKLWMWGVGANGRLGLGDTVDVRIPRRVRLPEDCAVLQIALGTFHSVALCLSNKKRWVYTWGSGEAVGSLGEGDPTVVSIPRLLDVTDASDSDFSYHSVLQVAAGAFHTLLLQENGDIVAFGQGACGRLGLSKTKNHGRPKRVGAYGFSLRQRNALDGSKVVRSLRHKSETRAAKGTQSAEESRESWEIRQVCCGDMHTAAITYGGDLYTWGCGENGQLGFGDREDSWVPRLVSFGKKVQEIALGTYHCLAMTVNGDVYSWGKGESGQLGLGRNDDTLVPKKINEIKDALAISAGDEHSAAVCRMSSGSTNVLWTWGSTHSGKLGVPDCFSTSTLAPTQVEDYSGLDAKPSPVSVCCGQSHTAVICYEPSTERRRVFTFGGGMLGRLGHGNEVNQYTPKHIEGLEFCALSVACGSDHTVAIAKMPDGNDMVAGYLWVWGKGSAICEYKDVLAPKKFTHLDNRFVLVACSTDHTLAITGIGLVYAWGDNSNGQLGQLAAADNEGDIGPKATRLPPRPRLLATGAQHTIAVFQDKDTYCWGNQRGGRLGLAERTAWKVVDRPSKVDAQWASVEAIGQVPADKAEEGGAEEERAAEDSDSDESVTGKANRKEQPLLYWWREKLSSLASGRATYVPTVGSFKVESVNEVHGEAFVADQRGVMSKMFDLKFSLDVGFDQDQPRMQTPRKRQSRSSWRTSSARSGIVNPADLQHSGRVELVDFSSIVRKSGKAFPVQVLFPKPEACELVANHFVPLLLLELNKLVAEFEKKPDDEAKDKPTEQPDSNKRMLQAITTNSQKITLFSTMQALLKSEPEDTKMPALRALEQKLNKDLSVFFQLITKLPEKEERVTKLQCDFEQSFIANLRFIKKLPAPDYAATARKVTDKLSVYQELLWVLQQQAFYLGTLSMFLGPGDEETFQDAVSCIFAEKDDARTLNLFLVLMKLIIFKEIEQAKSLKDLFRPEGRESHVFRLLRSFALDKIHYKEVVHPIMDSTDADSLLGRALEMANQGQAIAFNPTQYQEFPSHKDRLKECDTLEVKNEFTGRVALVRKFFRSDFLDCLRSGHKHYKIPESLLKLFDYTVKKVKKRQFPDAGGDTDISAETVVYLPILYLFVNCTLIPMMQDPQKYAGSEVFLSPYWKETGLEEDVIYNLNGICEFLEATIKNEEGHNEQLLSQIAKTQRPEILKYVKEQVAEATDDIDTLVTIDLYISHFDRKPHTISIETATLMKLSNLLQKNLGKLRLNQDDPLERLCDMIGVWSDEDIRSAEGTVQNFTINTRWLLTEKTMVICPTSHCPVPPRFSTESSSEDSTESRMQLLMPFSPETTKYGDQLALLEGLFYDLDALKSDSFDGLIAELRQIQLVCRQKSDFDMAQRLQSALESMELNVKMGLMPADLLDNMTTAVNERDMRKRYLEDVKREISSLRWAEKRHTRELLEAEKQLMNAVEMSRSVTVPATILREANNRSLRLRLETVAKRMEGLDELGRKGIKACSFSPMVTKSLRELRRERIVKEADPWLESVERAGGCVYLTFVLSERGVDITVTVSRQRWGRTVKSNVRYIRIPDEKVQDLHRAQEDAIFELPEDKWLVKVMTFNLANMLGKLAKT